MVVVVVVMVVRVGDRMVNSTHAYPTDTQAVRRVSVHTNTRRVNAVVVSRADEADEASTGIGAHLSRLRASESLRSPAGHPRASPGIPTTKLSNNKREGNPSRPARSEAGWLDGHHRVSGSGSARRTSPQVAAHRDLHD